MVDKCDTCSEVAAKDWASDWRTLAGLWGLPGTAMLAAGLLEPVSRAIVWTAMLTWMGAACFLNARRCSRTHCRITGPFFFVMAALVTGYASGILPIGRHGWAILGGLTFAGFVILWWGSEYAWGRFSTSRNAASSRNLKLL
ncbi:hypothetical protein LJR090_002026 [Bosea sp. LjRoot90]|uniref:hypothetical protein n=1 Tax=Bosea sp. LjRoot90 TaxID=3342342 RepID=UPI003ECD00AD